MLEEGKEARRPFLFQMFGFLKPPFVNFLFIQWILTVMFFKCIIAYFTAKGVLCPLFCRFSITFTRSLGALGSCRNPLRGSQAKMSTDGTRGKSEHIGIKVKSSLIACLCCSVKIFLKFKLVCILRTKRIKLYFCWRLFKSRSSLTKTLFTTVTLLE